jgi:prolipoprotein diacylglyceryltransferase
LGLCLSLLWWLPRRRQPGEILGIWLLVFSLAEFFLNYYRGENRLLVFGGPLSLTQAVDFCMVVLGALLLLERRPARLRA